MSWWGRLPPGVLWHLEAPGLLFLRPIWLHATLPGPRGPSGGSWRWCCPRRLRKQVLSRVLPGQAGPTSHHSQGVFLAQGRLREHWALGHRAQGVGGALRFGALLSLQVPHAPALAPPGSGSWLSLHEFPPTPTPPARAKSQNQGAVKGPCLRIPISSSVSGETGQSNTGDSARTGQGRAGTDGELEHCSSSSSKTTPLSCPSSLPEHPGSHFTLPPSSCVEVSHPGNLSEPQFLHLQDKVLTAISSGGCETAWKGRAHGTE